MSKVVMSKLISFLLSTTLLTVLNTSLTLNSANAADKSGSKNVAVDNSKKKKVTDTSSKNISICETTNIRAHRAIQVPTPKIKPTFSTKTFTLNTNCGDIVIEADGAKAPVTVQVLASLANNRFFDQTLCHRLEASNPFILQCGDPTGSGMGGPPFTYDDENKPATKPNNYPAGTVAMANAGLDSQGRGTNGSQFFIVYQDSSLDGNYTIWGRVTKGLDIVKQVAAAGVNSCDPLCKPNQKIAIISARVK
jgi:peptidyl-prolyl cis-trans isomerase B (cyclophilin B)